MIRPTTPAPTSKNYSAFVKDFNGVKSNQKLSNPTSLPLPSLNLQGWFDFSFKESKLFINKFKKFHETLHEGEDYAVEEQQEEEKVYKNGKNIE